MRQPLVYRVMMRVWRQCVMLCGNAPELDLLEFPAWDCLPYDRLSPRGGLLASVLKHWHNYQLVNGIGQEFF